MCFHGFEYENNENILVREKKIKTFIKKNDKGKQYSTTKNPKIFLFIQRRTEISVFSIFYLLNE